MIDKKCLYCTEAHEYADRDENNAIALWSGDVDIGIFGELLIDVFIRPKKELAVMATDDCNDMLRIGINYCPMCGRKL